eukprot:CAMPEP_0170607248 /NCGR_PEP_ID=MMETSP0224-20130122/20951_1 /TAXON_ID=285029 /ORGANISM="Togula jolla, Strain CCCM 725" /LENGTH=239 /DNA_ID=CAMNT_0010932397 /DNA_START=79 /DNA_END=797 /DNA_ORIENTATION=-
MPTTALNLTSGITEYSSRIALKMLFGQFGEVTACWIPPLEARRNELAYVKFNTAAAAQAALDAASAGQLYLDGVCLKAEWRMAPARTQDSRDFEARGSNLMTSRDLMRQEAKERLKARDRGRKDEDKEKDRKAKDRDRSREREGSGGVAAVSEDPEKKSGVAIGETEAQQEPPALKGYACRVGGRPRRRGGPGAGAQRHKRRHRFTAEGARVVDADTESCSTDSGVDTSNGNPENGNVA